MFYSLVNLQPEEKAKLKQPTYRSNEFQFFQQGVYKFILPVNLTGVNVLWQPKIDFSEMPLKLLKSLHLR